MMPAKTGPRAVNKLLNAVIAPSVVAMDQIPK
jgi:hypothetical protein